jgi:hypothetical protein
VALFLANIINQPAPDHGLGEAEKIAAGAGRILVYGLIECAEGDAELIIRFRIYVSFAQLTGYFRNIRLIIDDQLVALVLISFLSAQNSLFQLRRLITGESRRLAFSQELFDPYKQQSFHLSVISFVTSRSFLGISQQT